VASVLAALLYAAASVLQHRAAMEVPVEHHLRIGLLTALLAKPWWLAGIAADGVAFVLQFIALDHGALVVVQPLLVCGLLFALPFGSWVSHQRITAADLRAAGLVAVGLAVLLVAANPETGRSELPDHVWLWTASAVLVPSGIAVLVAGRWRAGRPALLAAAAGAIYAFTAALAKVTASRLDHGVVHALSSWELWALIPAGLLGMIVVQSAFGSGALKASLPTLSAVDPVVSILIGVTAFHEHLDQAPLKVALEVVAVAALTFGVFQLARSPLVALEEEKTANARPA